MGEMHRVRDTLVGREVAIKVLPCARITRAQHSEDGSLIPDSDTTM